MSWHWNVAVMDLGKMLQNYCSGDASLYLFGFYGKASDVGINEMSV